ncbi:MAG: exodeoxyribonuclease III [Burkholderiales bacterium]|nr:exodeoxyribonuclease III [Burkholderiales bacterium]
MKIATWNVNSLKVRLPHVLDWLQQTNCDVLGLQELKQDNAANEKMIEAFAEIGYKFVFNGQKTYNGVALLSKHPMENIVFDTPNYEDEQKRVIAATINGVRVICAYFVNGESLESPKYQYKLLWLAALEKYVAAEMAMHEKLVLIGDYNIAPEPRDTYDASIWEGQVLCSEPERKSFNNLIAMGLTDSFRKFNQEDRQYSWWDYRNLAFRKKQGLRIDHILASQKIMELATNCVVDTAPRKLERPSDHAPVMITLQG